MSKERKLYIGTSGWMYKHWKNVFYPEDLKKGFLTYFANQFSTVEVNSSFYNLPAADTFKKWYSETPDYFIFSLKLSRYITHIQKLQDTREGLKRFLNNAALLREKSGAILIQFPPYLEFDKEILKNFTEDLLESIKGLPIHPDFAIEPRNESFIVKREEVIKILQPSNIGLVFPHSQNIPSIQPDDENLITDFVYLRFHGPSKFADSRYGKEGLMPWAERIEHWLDRGLTVYAYFNNDLHGFAIDDARTLKELCLKE